MQEHAQITPHFPNHIAFLARENGLGNPLKKYSFTVSRWKMVMASPRSSGVPMFLLEV